MKPPKELIELLHRFDLDVQAVALALRTSVVHEIGPCYESIFQIKKLVSILYSTTEKRMKDNICLIVVYRDHVNLMFPRGVDLIDPEGLLQGTGKAMRHIKMYTADDIERRSVRALLKQAKQRKDLGVPARPLRKVMTMMKTKPAETQPAWPKLF